MLSTLVVGILGTLLYVNNIDSNNLQSNIGSTNLVKLGFGASSLFHKYLSVNVPESKAPVNEIRSSKHITSPNLDKNQYVSSEVVNAAPENQNAEPENKVVAEPINTQLMSISDISRSAENQNNGIHPNRVWENVINTRNLNSLAFIPIYNAKFVIRLINSNNNTIGISNLPTQKNLPFINTVSVGYRVSKNSFIGIESRLENFGQKYNFVENNTPLIRTNNPQLICLGITYRYEANDNAFINNNIVPYFQGLIGGTSIGPLTKIQLGLMYNIIGNINFSAGAEYGLLLYNVQNAYYPSNKLGFNLGLGMNF
jgi:hypothetical protein